MQRTFSPYETKLLAMMTLQAIGDPLQLVAPQFNCATREFTFQSTGGDGSPIKYMAVGITGWSSNPGPYKIELYDDMGPFELFAQQNGSIVRFNWDWRAVCASQNTPAPTTPSGNPPTTPSSNPPTPSTTPPATPTGPAPGTSPATGLTRQRLYLLGGVLLLLLVITLLVLKKRR